MCERTVYYRLRDPEFKERVGALRHEWLRAALGKLTNGASDAADTLCDLAKTGTTEDKVKLGAAQSIFDLVIKVAQATEWQRKYEELQEQIRVLQQDPKQIN